VEGVYEGVKNVICQLPHNFIINGYRIIIKLTKLKTGMYEACPESKDTSRVGR